MEKLSKCKVGCVQAGAVFFDINKTIEALVDSIPTLKKATEENNFELYLEGKPSRPVYSIVKPSIHKP